MKHSAEMQRCLVDCDVLGAMKLWKHISPNMPQPKNDAEGLIVLHHARTQSISIPFKLRAYSHRWLCDNGLPSGLPDNLRPKAERIYPRVVEAVGVSVKALSEANIPLAKAIEQAMSDAVAEAYADGKRDPGFVKARMEEARSRVMRG
jgi:hypothetical protein